MKIMLSVEHPAWAYQFRHIINAVAEKGGQTIVLAIDKDGDLALLDAFGIPYVRMGNSTGKNVIEKAFIFLKTSFTYTWQCIKQKPQILIGRASPMMAIAAFLCRKPHIIFEDTEVSKFSLRLCRWFSSKIITPLTFPLDFGKKHVRLPTYKETFYLAPQYFTPDKRVLEEQGFDMREEYIIVRFIAWQASHDVGMSAVSNDKKIAIVQELSRFCRVYITSEKPLPEALEPFRLPLRYDTIHHALYYAKLVFTEGATMASEAVALGTHAVYMSPIQYASVLEQHVKFDLVYPYGGTERYEQGLSKAVELFGQPSLWQIGKEKREKMYEQLVDPNEYFLQTMRETIYDRQENG